MMRVAILGFGVVGSGIERIISGGFTPEVSEFQIVSILTRTPRGDDRLPFTTDLEEFLGSDFDVLLECSGSQDVALTAIKYALRNGRPVISANKQLVATHLSELSHLARRMNTPFLFDASVAGGIPWLRNLQLLRRTDTIGSFHGIMNGTSNFILNQMQQEKLSFSDALSQAQDLGFAEADPSADLNGSDLACKTVLSAATCWDVAIPAAAIPRFGIEGVRWPDLDWGAKRGLTLKFLTGANRTEGDAIEAFVCPVFVPAESTLATVRGNFNYCTAQSSHLGESGFLGQGAGSAPTAFAMVQDLLDVKFHSEDDCLALSGMVPALLEVPKLESQAEYPFYIRGNVELLDALRSRDLVAQMVDEDTAFTAPLSMREITSLSTATEGQIRFAAQIWESPQLG